MTNSGGVHCGGKPLVALETTAIRGRRAVRGELSQNNAPFKVKNSDLGETRAAFDRGGGRNFLPSGAIRNSRLVSDLLETDCHGSPYAVGFTVNR